MVEHESGDILNLTSVEKAVSGCDLVFHLAGLVSYRRADLDRQYQVNVLGTRNVMDASLRAGIKRVIHTSSIAGMGIPEPGAVGTEEIAYNLQGLGLNYCDSKHQAELEVMEFARKGLPVIILAPGIIFGEGDTHAHHRAIFLAVSKGWLIGCPSGGVSFCDINDVVEAHLSAITLGRPGERYALASDNLTYKEAARTLAQVFGTPSPKFEIPGWLLEFVGSSCEALFPLLGRRPPLTRQVAWLSQRVIFFSADKAKRELGFRATPFAETIRRTAKYYLKTGAKGAVEPGLV